MRILNCKAVDAEHANFSAIRFSVNRHPSGDVNPVVRWSFGNIRYHTFATFNSTDRFSFRSFGRSCQRFVFVMACKYDILYVILL